MIEIKIKESSAEKENLRRCKRVRAKISNTGRLREEIERKRSGVLKLSGLAQGLVRGLTGTCLLTHSTTLVGTSIRWGMVLCWVVLVAYTGWGGMGVGRLHMWGGACWLAEVDVLSTVGDDASGSDMQGQTHRQK